jgi:hypothetical protein
MTRNSCLTATLAVSVALLGLSLRADTDSDATAASEWAGEYWYFPVNSSMNMRLIITSGSRFSLIMGGCFGSSEIDSGRVAYRNGALLLGPRLPVLVPTRLGRRLYLVGADRVAEFAGAVFVRETGIQALSNSPPS